MQPSEQSEIVIVDDITENLQILGDILQENGYKVRPFPTARLALEGINKKNPDLILLDINMPGMNGYDMCKILKENNNTKDIPVLFISALGDVKDKIHAFELGGQDYITKPFKVSEVIARVQTHLSLYKYQKQIEEKNNELERTILQLKNTQAQLIHAEKMSALGILANGLAHEINNPITSIQGNTIVFTEAFHELLKLWNALKSIDDIKLQEKLTDLNRKLELNDLFQNLEEISQAILNASKRASGIIRNLIDFVRRDDNESILTDVNELVETSLKVINHQVQKNITLKKKYDNIPKIVTSPAKVNQIFVNILMNAIQAIEMKDSDGAETIEINTYLSADEGKENIVVSISDSGIGITKKIQSKIFDPFFTTKEVGKGTGLGLSVSHSLAEGIGGRIDFKSEPCKGSEFRIYLPVTEK